MKLDINISATKILDCYEEDRVKFWAPSDFSSEYATRHAVYIPQVVNRGQKFLAGDLDRLPPVDLDADVLRLPFIETYVEGFYTEGNAPGRIIFLCTEHPTSVYHKTEPNEEYRFAVRPIFLVKRPGEPETVIDPLYVATFSVTGSDSDRHPSMRLYKLTNREQDARYQATVMSSEEEARSAMTYALHQLLYFLAIISCSNVGTKEIVIPEKLNKARRSSGKRPFFQFKTLWIKSRDNYKTKTEEQNESKRASPCLHWRRGHIRKLQGGAKRVWVSSSVVGDPRKGVTDKTYKLH